MAETHIEDNTLPTEGFERARVWYVIPEGMVLVKKSIFGGRIFAKGSYTEEAVQDAPTQNLYLHTLPDSMLSKLRAKFATNARFAEDLAKVDREIAYRNSGGTIPDTPELASATVRVKGMSRRDIIRRRISAKYGIKFRWPWQSMMTLSLGQQTIDTAPVSINTAENLKIQFDTDYRYRIIDPQAYATEYNRLAEGNASQDPGKVINDKIGHELDQLTTDYMRTIPYEVLSKQKAINLINELAYDIASRDYIRECGVEITRLYITDIKLPESLVRAAEEKKAAAERAKALETQSKAEAAAKRRLLEAEATKPQQIFNQLYEAARAANPDLSDEQLFPIVAEMAKTAMAGQSILVQNAGNGGMGPMIGTMAAAGSALGGSRSDTPSDTDAPAPDVDESEYDDIISAYLDEDGYLNNRKLRIVVKELRGDDVVGDYQLSELTPEEKAAVVTKINELESAKRRRRSE